MSTGMIDHGAFGDLNSYVHSCVYKSNISRYKLENLQGCCSHGSSTDYKRQVLSSSMVELLNTLLEEPNPMLDEGLL